MVFYGADPAISAPLRYSVAMPSLDHPVYRTTVRGASHIGAFSGRARSHAASARIRPGGSCEICARGGAGVGRAPQYKSRARGVPEPTRNAATHSLDLLSRCLSAAIVPVSPTPSHLYFAILPQPTMASPSASTSDNLCWYCPRSFGSALHRSRHMAAVHPDEDRLAPPSGRRAVPAAACAPEVPAPEEEADAAGTGGGGGCVSSTDGGHREVIVVSESEDEDQVNPTGATGAAVRRSDGMERGSLAGPSEPRHATAGSISKRITEFYGRYPEAECAEPCADVEDANRPTFFNTPALQELLRFIVTSGGTGLSRVDQVALGSVLLALEPAFRPPDDDNNLHFRLPSAHSLVTAVNHEERRVLAARGWMQTPIDIGGREYTFFYRDMLQSVLSALRGAAEVQLNGARLDPTADGDERRSHTMNSDLFMEEQEDVRRIHGQAAHVAGVMLHLDEAVVAWNGASYVYPIRMMVVNVRGGDAAWETIGYVPHISKVVGNGKNARMRLAVSDGRRDMQQRCLAVVLRRFVVASERGVTLDLPARAPVKLVPRIVGLVVDQVEERGILCLMGCSATFNCSHCMARRAESCAFTRDARPNRPVVSTLEAQLHAAEVRIARGPARVRSALASSTSALPFVPALGAVHGLSTGTTSLYRIVTFDTLHVWKLGVLPLMARRLPSMLAAVCAGGVAVRGTVQHTMDAVNLRGFELGRLCRASPAAPGYVMLYREDDQSDVVEQVGVDATSGGLHMPVRMPVR